MTITIEYRHKAIVVPKLHSKYIVVNDTKNNELTFVVGGCKLRELKNLKQCAFRELTEETRSVLNETNVDNLTKIHEFSTEYRSKNELLKNKLESKKVIMIYHIYTCVPKLKDFSKIKAMYHRRKSTNNETNGIFLMTKAQLQRANMWSFMKLNVLQHV